MPPLQGFISSGLSLFHQPDVLSLDVSPDSFAHGLHENKTTQQRLRTAWNNGRYHQEAAMVATYLVRIHRRGRSVAFSCVPTALPSKLRASPLPSPTYLKLLFLSTSQPLTQTNAKATIRLHTLLIDSLSQVWRWHAVLLSQLLYVAAGEGYLMFNSIVTSGNGGNAVKKHEHMAHNTLATAR